MDMMDRPLFSSTSKRLQDKAIDQLYGICTGILADGEVSPKEAEFFREWIRRYAGERPVWPLTEILVRIERIFADGVCDKEECEELRSVMESICGYTSGNEEPMESEEPKPAQHQAIPERRSITLPLCSPAPEPLIFSDRRFVITGKFAFGTRKKVIEAIEQRRGTGIDDHPCRDDHFLLIGAFPSKLWAHGNFGRKIEFGVELRSEGSGLCIISEEHWRRFL
jgi:hypothetical protein